MKHLWQNFVIALALTSVGCSTIRMDYTGDVTRKDGKKAKYKLVKSYDVEGPHAALCGITAIFFGGFCWYYTVMPTTAQSAKIEGDAKLRLNKTYGDGSYTLTRKVVNVESWKPGEEVSVVTEIDEDSTPSSKQAK